MIRMRKEVPELGWGNFSVLELDEPGILAIRYDWRNVGVLTLHNLRDAALEIEISLDRGDGMRLSNLLTGHHSEADRRGRHRIVMEPYGYHWYRLGGLTYLLDRSDD